MSSVEGREQLRPAGRQLVNAREALAVGERLILSVRVFVRSVSVPIADQAHLRCDAIEVFGQCDVERSARSGGMPHETMTEHLGRFAALCPAFDDARVDIDDEVIRHANVHVEFALRDAVGTHTARRNYLDGKEEGSDIAPAECRIRRCTARGNHEDVWLGDGTRLQLQIGGRSDRSPDLLPISS